MKVRLFLVTLVLFGSILTPQPAQAQLGDGNCFLGLLSCTVEGTADFSADSTVNETEGARSATSRRTTSSSADVNEGVVGYILRLGYFINIVVLPLLFGIALLLFLFNIVRYFIFSSNVEEKEQARRVAIYGIAAFIFLVSIWGIVNVFVNGLGFDNEESLCPDYLGTWCSDKSFVGTYTRPDAGNGGGSSGNRVPTGSYSGTPALVDVGCGSGEDPGCKQDRQYSGLAELVFGDYRDGADLTSSTGAPQAAGTVVAINEASTCEAGFLSLIQAANVERLQAAYVLYTNSNGATRWENVTNTTSRDRVAYHRETIDQLKADGASDIVLVHTHPEQRTVDATLSMTGHSPSTADISLMCTTGVRDLEHITVDQGGLWKLDHNPALACPRSQDLRDTLPLVETLYALSLIERGDRDDEFELLLESNQIPNSYQPVFESFADTSFDRLTDITIRNFVASELADLDLHITRTSAQALCSER